jgi:hypothetical protein
VEEGAILSGKVDVTRAEDARGPRSTASKETPRLVPVRATEPQP